MTKAVFEKVVRGFHPTAKYGKQEFLRFFKMCRTFETTEGPKLVVFPGGKVGDGEGPPADPHITRVLKKIVRGYSFAKGLDWPVSEERVQIKIFNSEFPAELLESINYEHRDASVFECWWYGYPEGELESVWLLQFYGKVRFAAVVMRSSHSQ